MARKKQEMKIVVNYPETPEGWAALQERIDEAHYRAICSYIEKLPWTAEDKLALWKALKEEVRKGAEAEKREGIEPWMKNAHLARR